MERRDPEDGAGHGDRAAAARHEPAGLKPPGKFVAPGDDSAGIALVQALEKLGLRMDVTVEGTLAILLPRNDASAAALRDGAVRDRVMSAAREAGFTHAALELASAREVNNRNAAADEDDAAHTGIIWPFGADGRDLSLPERVRLFIAVEIDGAIQEQVDRRVMQPLRKRFPDASWVRPGNLHLTLKFLGDTPSSSIQPIAEALVEAVSRFPTFQVTLGGVGAFPSLQRPRVIWLGMRGDGAARCASLAAIVDEVSAGFDFRRENRKFRGHVTLARVRRQGRDASLETRGRHGLAAIHRHTTAWRVPVTHVALVMSELSSEGSRYSTLARCPLGRA